MVLKLTELDGVGEVRAKKLTEAGVATPYDIVIRGAKELADLMEMKEDVCDHMVEQIKAQLREEGKIPKTDQDSRKLYRKQVIRLDTGSGELNGLLSWIDEDDPKHIRKSGGIETQAVTEIYGADGAGKTQAVMTLIALTLEAGYGVYMIDCEGTFDDERLNEICRARNINPDMTKLNVEIAFDSNSVLRTINTLTQKIIDDNIKLIVIDGALGLLRSEHSVGLGDLKARQDKMKPFLLHIKNMAFYMNIAVVITNQVYGDPSPWGGDEIKPVGGMVVGHAPRYIFWFKKNSKNKRTVTFKKSPRHPMSDIVIYLNEEGISDSEVLKKKKVE